MAPLMRLCTNRRDLAKEPQITFRIVHLTGDAATTSEAIEQRVEVGLGPDRPFGRGEIGHLTRLVPAARTFRTGRKIRRKKEGDEGEPPKIVELLHKAEEWRRQLDAGEVASQAETARREGITRARVTQVLGLLRLPAEVRRQILANPITASGTPVTERMLRRQLEAQADASRNAFLASSIRAPNAPC